MSEKNYTKGKSNGNYKSKTRKRRNGWKKDKDKETVDKPTNDPSWYLKYPQLVTDTGSLFFSNPLGARVPKLDTSDTSYSTGTWNNYVPGIITLDCIAVPGYSNSPNSPINALTRGIYSFIRHANSGHSNYEAADLMMYLLAMDTCYTFWATCVRAYGIARLYNVRSRYVAVNFLKAMGFDADDILSNLAQFRATINNFAVRMSSFAVPANMDYFRRHTDMYTRIYLDEPSDKAQAYMFKLAKYYKLNNTSSDGTKVILTDFPSATMTLLDVRSVMNDLVNPIISDEDMNIMSGDILKAFGEGGIFKLALIPEEYTTERVFDATVLTQIENSMTLPDMDIDSLGVTQDPATNAIYCAPFVAGTTDVNLIPKKLLNMHHDAPQPIEVMEATRLMYSIEKTVASTNICNFGAELVMAYTVWSFNAQGGYAGFVVKSVETIPATMAGADRVTLQRIAAFTSFNYHPRIALWVIDGNNKYMVSDFYALDNYTELEDNTLFNLSNTAMLSLFDAGRIALP